MAEYMGKGVRYDSSQLRGRVASGHCVGLARTSLSVRKDRPIIAFEYLFDDRTRCLDINVHLRKKYDTILVLFYFKNKSFEVSRLGFFSGSIE